MTNTKTVNNWTIIQESSIEYHDTITPQLTVIDPVGQKKSLGFNGGGFAGPSSKFSSALDNFCNANASWADAGFDDRVFFVGAILNDYIQ